MFGELPFGLVLVKVDLEVATAQVAHHVPDWLQLAPP